jgi:hypothetical protein
VYVVGNAIDRFDGGRVPDAPFAAYVLGGERIGRPAGRFNFVFPKAITDARGRLQVFWAEPHSGPVTVRSDQWPPRPLIAIWTARYARASGWSSPRSLYEGEMFLWEPGPLAGQSTTAAVEQSPVTSAARAGAVVATMTGLPHQPLLWVRAHADTWSIDTIPNSALGSPVQPSIAVDGARTYLVFLAPAGGAVQDQNSVFFQRSEDDGRTWSSSALVSRSGPRPAMDVTILVASDHAIHLVWRQERTDGRSVLDHTVSRDAGATWSPPDEFAHPEHRRNLRAAVDACGTVHLVMENWEQGYPRVRLEYVTWSHGWSAPAVLFPDWRGLSPSLALSPGGQMHLIFVGNRDPDNDRVPLETLYSAYTR